MAAGSQGEIRIQKGGGPGDHTAAPFGVEAAGFLGTVVLGDDIRAVERVVETAPPGVGSVEGVAGVIDRHHQLRAGDLGHLAVDIGRGHRHLARVGLEVANLFEKRPVGRIGVAAGVVAVPLIDPGLQRLASLEQRRIAGPEIADNGRQPLPESIGVNAGARNGFAVDQFIKGFGNLQPGGFDALAHGLFLVGGFSVVDEWLAKINQRRDPLNPRKPRSPHEAWSTSC